MILRKSQLIFALIGLAIFGSTPAFAVSIFDHFIEPYVGYQVLGVSSVGPGVDAAKLTSYANYSGFTLGARVGTELLDFIFVALDGSSTPSLSTQLNTTGQSFNTSPTTPLMISGPNTKIGLVAGIVVPVIGFRVWAGYNFIDQLTGSSSTTLNGYSIKLGAGTPILRIFSLNVEFLTHYYSKFSSQGGNSMSNPQGSMNNSHLLLSLSAPITL